MVFLIQQTLLFAVPLMIVALAGVCAERSGVINLALEGIMIFGAFVGVLFIRIMQENNLFGQEQGQLLMLLAMLVSAVCGGIFSLLLAFSAINLKADQTIGGTALNMLSPAIVLFFIVLIAQQNTLGMAKGGAASWFMIRPSTFGLPKDYSWGPILDILINKVYLSTYICILVFVIVSVVLYKTRFGLRLRSCGENPQAAGNQCLQDEICRCCAFGNIGRYGRLQLRSHNCRLHIHRGGCRLRIFGIGCNDFR